MAGPAVVIVAGVITAGLAIKSWDGLVADDYYKQGLGINQVKTRDHNARVSGLSAQIQVSGRAVQVFVQGQDAQKGSESLTLRLIHPTRNGQDQAISLGRQGQGLYRGNFDIQPEGRFNVVLEDVKGEWRLAGVWQSVADDEPIILRPVE